MQRITVIHTGAVGDLVQALPALAAVRRAHPEAEVTFVGRPERGDLARAAGVADARVDLETSGLWRLTAEGGGAVPGAAWLAEADLVLDFLTGGALASRTPAGPRVVTLRSLPPEDWAQPAAAFVVKEVCAALGLPAPADDRPAIALDADAVEAGRRGLEARGVAGPLVLVHPGSGSVRKNWPMERFVAVADRVRRETDRAVVWLAGPAEVERGTVPGGGETVLSDLSLVEAAAVCGRAEVYLGNDSGMTQIAAAVRMGEAANEAHWRIPARRDQWHPAVQKTTVDLRSTAKRGAGKRTAGQDRPWHSAETETRRTTPVVALFGPTDARVWAPRGDHVRVLRSRDGTMAGIGVEAVWVAVATAVG